MSNKIGIKNKNPKNIYKPHNKVADFFKASKNCIIKY